MLKKIAEIFETSVSQLLGSPIVQEENVDSVAEQLAKINEQLIIKNRRSRRVWKTIGIVALVIVLGNLLLMILGMVAFDSYKFSDTYIEESTEEIIED